MLSTALFPRHGNWLGQYLFGGADRRAALASVLVYVVALGGIMDTVLDQPISAVLATSGVLAIVLNPNQGVLFTP